MLVRIALCVLGVVDVVVFAWQALTERQQHPHFLQESLDHRVFVVGASAMLVVQIVAWPRSSPPGAVARGRPPRLRRLRFTAC
jgi:hypothetical protein